ncbi:type IV secretory system conjugative DNA transfer family protein [Hymenobacter sp. HSC-4F20]|uniref:type IV secretory system conjugative DNA transfer family protein n=1 Tax=Hymenobacter sp. HSC-4F20 TaxID=2864135 RepID=UPI001C736C50|nr:type IV secretory system conjugative DNA transfer family protein [Hymenobacter sp. HSC-4F20]MBX0289737.1 type IV secretory system conjugative DNA transfer family protein [Hymenobacter sp. HSC-4F20]
MATLSLGNIYALLQNKQTPGSLAKMVVIASGLFFTPITMAGALWGYVRGYNRFIRGNGRPDMTNMPPIVVAGMVLFAVLTWVLLGLAVWFLKNAAEAMFTTQAATKGVLSYLGFNLVFSVLAFFIFKRWQAKEHNIAIERGRHGSARIGTQADMLDLSEAPGLFIGGNMGYRKQGHILTVGSTRSGKGTSLIIPALLDRTENLGSMVIIDPKGENAAITGRYQKEKGMDVLLLDPWGVNTKQAATFNPMDILKPGDELADDAMMLAEMIVPDNPNDRDPFWANRARSIIAALIMHLQPTGGTLIDLWRLLRLDPKEWIELVAKMQVSDNEIISATGNEIEGMMANDKMFGSVMATALHHTDFLKSPALQRSLTKSSFNVNDLTKGSTVLYVIIPADKLKSHYQWLRLVVTTSIKATVRNHNLRVTFILDEFPSLGPLKEISEFGMAAAAGFNITFWMIAQSLPQLKNLYRDNWENFIANTSVRQYVGVNDNFTAEYVSRSIGNETFHTYNKESGQPVNVTARPLLTPDEVRAETEEMMIIQVDRRPTVLCPKIPYLAMPDVAGHYDENPYHKGGASIAA